MAYVKGKLKSDLTPYIDEITEAQAEAYFAGHKKEILREVAFYIDEEMVGPPNVNRKNPHAWNWSNWAWYCIAYEKIKR